MRASAPASRPRTPKSCPRCHSSTIAPIMYGYPADMNGALKAANEGEIILGGCVIEDASPSWGCGTCGHRWGKLG